ncbi:MAG: hypothetical protein AAF682_15760 [Planctomycetota bacterium]
MFAVLIALWPAVRSPYLAGCAWTGNRLFSDFGADRAVDCRVLEPRREWIDAEIRLYHREHPQRFHSLAASGFLHAFVPWAVFLSLVLATPATRKARLARAALGSGLVALFTAARIGLRVARDFTWIEVDGVRLLSLDPRAYSWLDSVSYVLFKDPTIGFVLPVAIWALVSVRWFPELARREP